MTTKRLDSVDLVRGLAMILMALDHTRDYFGNAADSPTNLATASAPLFLTRWITHFCAPTFSLLTGVGAYLMLRRRAKPDVSRFLLTRGIWLVVFEQTIMRFLWQFNVDYRLTILNVLWALGWSMIVLALLVWLPVRAVAAISIAMIALHNLTDGTKLSGALWTILHRPGPLYATDERMVFVAYPLIPWIGVMSLGYALGPIFDWPAERRRAFLLRAGVGSIVAFVLLRAVNVYGDPLRWSHQKSALFSVLSFFNATKYPPSLLFLLMTLGPALLFLRAVDGRTPRVLAAAVTIGRVPFFYYAGHVLVLHLIAVGASLVRYGTIGWAIESPTLDKFPITQPPGWPASLPVVYLIWISVVLIMYPLCRWYARYKATHDAPWLSYL